MKMPEIRTLSVYSCIGIFALVLAACTPDTPSDSSETAARADTTAQAAAPAPAAASDATSSTGDIEGTVRDASGNPILMVNLNLADLQRGAMAGPGGEYSIRNLPPGEYEVEAAYPGVLETVTVQVLADSTVRLDIQFDE